MLGNYKGLKISVCVGNWGKLSTNMQKDQKPNSRFWGAGSKAGYSAGSLEAAALGGGQTTQPSPLVWAWASPFAFCCLVAKSCLTLCKPMGSSLPGSSDPGISQVGILEWFVISFSRGSSWPRDWTRLSCIGRRFFSAAAWEAQPRPSPDPHKGPACHSHSESEQRNLLSSLPPAAAPIPRKPRLNF